MLFSNPTYKPLDPAPSKLPAAGQQGDPGPGAKIQPWEEDTSRHALMKVTDIRSVFARCPDAHHLS